MYGEIKSKLEVRQFAVQQANFVLAKHESVTVETFIEAAKAIEAYVIGAAELPETPSTENEYLKTLTALLEKSQNTKPAVVYENKSEEHSEVSAE